MIADILIRNARILTPAPVAGHDGALALSAGRIMALGDAALALAGPGTEVIDADGATVLPGFVESHMHLFPGAFSLCFLQLSDISGEGALTDALRAYADANPDEDLLIAQSTDYAILGEDRRLDRHVLDRILPDRPVALMSCDFHNVWCNTPALERAGLLQGRDVGPGAEVELGADGLATGLLKEFAAYAPALSLRSTGGRENLGFENAEPGDVTPDERAADIAALRDGLAQCAALGITTIINMDGNRYQLDLLAEIEATGGLPCRVEIPYHFTPGEPLDNLDRAEAFRAEFDGARLWCRRIKLFMDGVLDASTAYRLSDYPGRPGFRSAPLHDPQVFADIATEADRRGFQISVHAIGDGAVRTVLDGYAAARRVNGARDSRHRIEHIEMIHPDDVPRLAELGVVASLQPVHPPGCDGFPLEPTVSLIGRDEWDRAYPWATLARTGAKVCFSSDWPVATLDPLHGIVTALSRRPWSADLPDERLSFADTLVAYSSGGAFAAHLEHELGSLAPGMAGDVVVLSGDLEQALATGAPPPPVACTICDGRVTYRRS